MATYTPKINTNKWWPDKSDLVAWVYDITKYLQDTPIPTEEAVEKAVDKYLQENPITGNFYSPDNPPPYPVTSVNGKTGAVTIDVDTSGLYSPTNPPPYPVTSVNGKTGAVTSLYDASNPPPYPVTSVNGQTGAVTVDVDTSGLYSPTNPPPYPVTSVNGKTGAVTVPGLTVGPVSPITPTNVYTNNVTLTLNGYTKGKYKMVFVKFFCNSVANDTSIKLVAKTSNVVLYSGAADFDGTPYDYNVEGVICYPTALDDEGVLSFVASNANAKLFTNDSSSYWFGVE